MGPRGGEDPFALGVKARGGSGVSGVSMLDAPRCFDSCGVYPNANDFQSKALAFSALQVVEALVKLY